MKRAHRAATMRVRASQLAFLALLMGTAACKQQKVETQPSAEQSTPRMASVLRLADARSASQLVSGFYSIENDSWRWTGKRFALNLGVPAGAAQNGAILELKLTVPQVTIDKLQSVTLSGSVNDTALAPETYSKAGQYSFHREVPASALTGDSAKVSFQLDKAMRPAGGDVRELGIIASSVALQAK